MAESDQEDRDNKSTYVIGRLNHIEEPEENHHTEHTAPLRRESQSPHNRLPCQQFQGQTSSPSHEVSRQVSYYINSNPAPGANAQIEHSSTNSVYGSSGPSGPSGPYAQPSQTNGSTTPSPPSMTTSATVSAANSPSNANNMTSGYENQCYSTSNWCSLQHNNNNNNNNNNLVTQKPPSPRMLASVPTPYQFLPPHHPQPLPPHPSTTQSPNQQLYYGPPAQYTNVTYEPFAMSQLQYVTPYPHSTAPVQSQAMGPAALGFSAAPVSIVPQTSVPAPTPTPALNTTSRYNQRGRSQAQSRKSTEKYTCKECNKSYAYKKHLHRHAKIHTGERQYQCDLCRSAFTRSDILKRHRERCLTRSREQRC